MKRDIFICRLPALEKRTARSAEAPDSNTRSEGEKKTSFQCFHKIRKKKSLIYHLMESRLGFFPPLEELICIPVVVLYRVEHET